MPSRVCRSVFMTAFGFCVALSAVPAAFAALGGNPMTTPQGATTQVVQPSAASTTSSSSTSQSQAVMRSASSAAATSYTVRETTLASGTVVREYLSLAGTVFAIAWTGPQMPDLGSLLGSYFPQYVDGLNAVRATRGGHGPAAVESSTLIVHSGGHMGAFSGQAWLPQALPAGVSGSDIQ
ncbi:DUF2844 domain-containing protein [Paraburkholderia sp.]|uniref:DUF2844 domain-containing protein n=1 Tax=Paraburkholderia sp. TaxID=1926495 RepID=UPI003D6F954C